MTKILQSIPYPTYTTAERDLLVDLLKNTKINNSDTGKVEEYDGYIWNSVGGNIVDQTAANTTVDATGFNGNLTPTDDTVQKVAQKFDDYKGATRTHANLTVISNEISLDFVNLNEFVSSNRVAIPANASVVFANNTSAQFATFKILISNLATLTFPVGSISCDSRISSRVFTPSENGNYSVSIYITGSEYEVIISSNPAV